MTAFSTTAVLTLATGTVMADMAAIHALITHYAGGPVWTHQIPLLFPELEAAARITLGDRYEPFDKGQESWKSYRDRMLVKIGDTIEVAARKPFHRADAALADAVKIMGGDRSKVIVVANPSPAVG